MKKSITLLTLVLLTILSKAQTTIAPDTISVNTTWQDTVYLDTNVYIQNSVKLTINPRTKVIANGNYKIEVQGSLQAIGTEQDSILFTINDTTGLANTAVTYGGWGGIELLNTNQTNDSTIFEYCIMQYGKANGVTADEQIGGVLNVNNFSKIRISNSLIQHNLAKLQGGGFLFKESSPLINYNIFNDNYVFDDILAHGGALCILENSRALIQGNTFKYNKAGMLENYGMMFYVYTGSGAAISLSSDNANYVPVIKNNRFYNNECTQGSAIQESTRKIIFVDNIMANNIGRVIYFGHTLCHSEYLNNTIINNNTYDYYPVVDFSSYYIKFINNIIVGYTDDSHFSQPLLAKAMGTVVNFNNIKYNYFQYGDEFLAGEGNIVGGDPSTMFVNPSTFVGIDENAETYNYALQNSGVCVNNGILDTAGLNLPEYDIIGTQRIFGGRIDIGAYENKTMIYNNFYTITENNKIEIFPNPTKGQITIESKDIEKVEIYNTSGVLIKSSTTNKIDIREQAKGEYFVKIITKEGAITKKIILE